MPRYLYLVPNARMFENLSHSFGAPDSRGHRWAETDSGWYRFHVSRCGKTFDAALVNLTDTRPRRLCRECEEE